MKVIVWGLGALFASGVAHGKCDASAKAVFHVKAGASGGDGTSSNPFGKVAQAAAQAAKINSCTLEVRLASGTHVGNLTLDRPTTLRAWTAGPASPDPVLEGRVSNKGGYALTIRNVSLRKGKGFGVLQEGGSLVLHHVEIEHVSSTTGKVDSGIGLIVRGGATAKLDQVELSHNASQGVLVSGSGTTLYAQGLSLNKNRLIGFALRDGAKAHLRDSRVKTTLALGSEGGHNIAVLSGSVLEFHKVDSQSAALAGIQIHDAFATGSDSAFSNNEWGVAIGPLPREGYRPRDCLKPNVRAFDNRSADVHTESPDVPSSSCPGGNCGSNTVCEKVPWSG